MGLYRRLFIQTVARMADAGVQGYAQQAAAAAEPKGKKKKGKFGDCTPCAASANVNQTREKVRAGKLW